MKEFGKVAIYKINIPKIHNCFLYWYYVAKNEYQENCKMY